MVETKWKNDIISFAQNYKAPVYNKVETEKLFLIEINGHYLQGIIDLLIYNEDGTVSIRDYNEEFKYLFTSIARSFLFRFPIL